jgi:hypothetical protein
MKKIIVLINRFLNAIRRYIYKKAVLITVDKIIHKIYVGYPRESYYELLKRIYYKHISSEIDAKIKRLNGRVIREGLPARESYYVDSEVTATYGCDHQSTCQDSIPGHWVDAEPAREAVIFWVM